MSKTKIKRVIKNKRKITPREKLFAGLGLASNLLGGGGGVALRQAPTRIVSQNTHAQDKSQRRGLLSKIFGVKQAKADSLSAEFVQDSALLSYEEMSGKYQGQIDSYIYQFLSLPWQYPSVFSSNSLCAQLLGLSGAESVGADYSGFSYQGDGMWHNANFNPSFAPSGASYSSFSTSNNNSSDQPGTNQQQNNSITNVSQDDLPENFAYSEASSVLGLSSGYNLISNGGVAKAIYVNDSYYELQSDYTYKKTASGAQARSLATSGGMTAGTIYLTRKYAPGNPMSNFRGFVGKIIGIFKGSGAASGTSAASGEFLPATGKILTPHGVEMDLADAIDTVLNDPNEAYRLGLNENMQSEITTPTGAQMSLEDAARRSTQPVMAQSFGLVGIAPAVIGGVAIGVTAATAGAAGTAVTSGIVGYTAIGSVLSSSAPIATAAVLPAGAVAVPGAIGLYTLPNGSMFLLSGSAATTAGSGAAAGGAASGAMASATPGATSGGLSSSLSSITTSIQNALSSALHAVTGAIKAAASWMISTFGVAGTTIIGAAVVGGIIGIRMILSRGQDKIRDSRRIEEVNPYIFEIVNTYNSVASNTIEEEEIFHAESVNAVNQLFEMAASKFERDQSTVSQRQYIDQFIAAMDATYNQRMEAHKGNLNFDVYEISANVREAYPPKGSQTGEDWGKVTVTTDGQGNITQVVSETGKMVPMSVIVSILSAEGQRLHTQNNLLMLRASELPKARINESFVFTLPHQGEGNLSFTITQGSLPEGLNLNAQTGQLFGTALEEGNFSFTVSLTNQNGESHEQEYNVYVSAAQRTAQEIIESAHVIAFSSLIEQEKQELETYLLANPDVITQLDFDSFHQGSVMAWALGMGSSSQLSEAARNLGFTNFDQASGLFVKTGETSESEDLNIVQPQLSQARVGQQYSFTLQASGGNGPYTFTIPSGQLPLGLSLSSEGLIFGVPTMVGNFTFSLEVTDSAGRVKRLDNLRIVVSTGAAVTGTNITVNNAQGSPMVLNGSVAPNVGYTFNRSTNSQGQLVFNISINNANTYNNLTIGEILSKLQEKLALTDAQSQIEAAALSDLYYRQVYNSPTSFNAQGQPTSQVSSTYAANNLNDGSWVTNLANRLMDENPGLSWETALSRARSQVQTEQVNTNYAGGQLNFTGASQNPAGMIFENPASHNLNFRDGDRWQLTLNNSAVNQNIYVEGTWIKPNGERLNLNELVGRTSASGSAVISRQLSSYHKGNWEIRVMVEGRQVGNTLNFSVN